jgi:cytochrome P450
MATQPEHFAQPQTFSMDRWLARGEAERGAHNPRAFVPFGGGPRFCPGRNLALLEIKVVLAMFCRNFELALANPAQSVAEAFAFTMGPENLQVRFQRRA